MEQKTERFEMRVSKQDRERLIVLAEAERRSKADAVRLALLEACQRRGLLPQEGPPKGGEK